MTPKTALGSVRFGLITLKHIISARLVAGEVNISYCTRYHPFRKSVKKSDLGSVPRTQGSPSTHLPPLNPSGPGIRIPHTHVDGFQACCPVHVRMSTSSALERRPGKHTAEARAKFHRHVPPVRRKVTWAYLAWHVWPGSFGDASLDESCAHAKYT